MSPIGTFETCRSFVWMSAFRAKAEVVPTRQTVANDSNRTFITARLFARR
jgi:hypothetical protein